MPYKDREKKQAAQREWYARNRQKVRDYQAHYKATAAGMLANMRFAAKERRNG